MKSNKTFPKAAATPPPSPPKPPAVPPGRHGLVIEDYVPYQLALLSSKLSHALGSVCQSECGITRNEWRVLALIGQSGVCAAASLVERKVMDTVAVHRAVKRLDEMRLISRETSQHDGRVRLLVLTKKGLQVYGKIVPYAAELERRLLAGLSAADGERFKVALAALLVLTYGPPFEAGAVVAE